MSGKPSITTLGTIATGTWNATTIDVNKGGTGATTYRLCQRQRRFGVHGFGTIPNTDITGSATMSTQNANLVAITGGTIDGVTLDGGTF